MPDSAGGARSRDCEVMARACPRVVLLLLCVVALAGCTRSKEHLSSIRPHTRPPVPPPVLPVADDQLRVAEAAEPAPPLATDAQARSILSLRLDLTEIAGGAPVTGVVRGKWDDDAVRLVWIDGLNRVVAAADVTPPEKDELATKFSLNVPPAAMGQQHRLVLLRAPRNALKNDTLATDAFRIEAEAAVRVIRAAAWNDYVAVLGGGCDAKSQQLWRVLRQNGIDAVWCGAAETAGLVAMQDVPFFGEALPGDANLLTPKQPWTALSEAFIRQRGDPKLLERKPALFDDATLTAARKALEKAVYAKRKAQPLAWSLGAASVTARAMPFDYDFSPATLDVFRAWLEQRYGSLQALNQAWGAEYKSWAEVVPPSTDQAKAAQNSLYAERLEKILQPPEGATPTTSFVLEPAELAPPVRENFAAWSDFRAFSDYAFARILREQRTWLRNLKETAPVGMVDAQPPSAFGGWDWWQLPRTLDWLEEHAAVFTRSLARSFSPETRMVAEVRAGSAAERYRIWDAWLRGDAGCLLAGRDRWVNSATLDLTPDGQALSADLRELACGLTRLRNTGRASVDPIALYYSPRSVQVQWMLDSQPDGSKWLERDARVAAARDSSRRQFEAWLMLLEDLGYTPSVLHPEQLVARELNVRSTKVLILPKVLCLSDAEVREIREFAREGGLVIADGGCGTFDALGRRHSLAPEPRPVGALDLDFGLARRNFVMLENNGEFAGDAAAARVLLRDATTQQPIGPESDELRLLEPGLVRAGAFTQAVDRSGVPALASRASGLGRFMYLNLCLQDYPILRAKPADESFRFHGLTQSAYTASYGAPAGGEALRLVVGDALATVLPEPPLRVRSDAGLPLRGIRRCTFALGKDAALFGLMSLGRIESADDGSSRVTGVPIVARTPAWVGIEQPRHWYDAREGKYLGHGKAVKTALEPDRPTVLAALPYKVERLLVKVRRGDPRGAFKVSASLNGAEGSAVRHALRIEVFDPAGNLLPHYCQNVLTEDGAWSGLITLGLNEPAGRYRLTVRDVISGKTAENELAKDLVQYASVATPAAQGETKK